MKHLILPAIMLFVTACGGGSGGNQSQETQSQSANQADGVRTIEMIGTDQMKYVVEEKQDGITTGGSSGNYMLLESISAEPGEKIRVRLTTISDLPESAMAHNFVLLTLSADPSAFTNEAVKAKDNGYIPADKKDQILSMTEMAAGGETVEVTFTAPEETGKYDYVCTFPGHYASGMKGKLIVQ